MIQLTLWGPITREENREAEGPLRRASWLALVPLCIFMLWIGVAPDRFLRPSRKALEGVLADYRGRVAEPDVAQATLRPPVDPTATAATAAQVSSTTTEAGQ